MIGTIGAIAGAGKVAKLALWLNLGDQTSTGTATGWTNIYAEPNPAEAAGTIDSSRGGVYAAWANIAGSGVSLRALNGVTTAERWGLFGGGSAGTTGQSTGNNSGIYPDTVLINLWFGNGSDPILELYGLDNAKTYKITLLGSRDSAVGGSRRTIYKVQGVNQAALQTVGNTSNIVVVNTVTPASGVIPIQLMRDDNAFTYINAIKIDEN